MPDDCLFCQLAAGVIPSTVVREDDEFIAFHDIAPKADTHVLVISRDHHANLDDFVAQGADANPMLDFVASTARELGIDGQYRLITNVGRDAGQVVFHLHWHLMAGQGMPGF